MFNTFNFMAINSCCILGGPYYPTLPLIVRNPHDTPPPPPAPSLKLCIELAKTLLILNVCDISKHLIVCDISEVKYNDNNST